MNDTNKHVLITGASSGIGLELAREFARHGHALIITSTTESELVQVGKDLMAEHGVDVHVMAQDLLQEDAPQQLFNSIKAQGLEVEILVNNAGVGHKGKFAEQPLEYHLEMIHLNIQALVTLTHAFLPGMIARGHGRILNTASIAGFMPAPLMAVYHASKAFVLSFSEAVATELKDTGVTLTALCPGATDTEFFERADALEAKGFQKGHVMAPQVVAEGGYKALMAGDRVYVAGGMNKAMVFSRRFLPNSFLTMMTEAMYSDVKPEDHQRETGDVAAKEEAKAHS